jgi:penicillin amidase
LLKNTLQDKLGEKLYLEYLKPMGGTGDVHAVFMEGIIDGNENPWFDNPLTPIRETRNAVMTQSFSEAVDELARLQGYDPSKWQWGKLHSTHFQHVLGAVPQLGVILSRGPAPTPGSRYTVNVAAFDYHKPYVVSAIPSYRQIIDWSSSDSFLAIHSTGQSGLPFAGHYDDMIERWLNVEYQVMCMQKDDIVRNSKALLRLEPALP